MSPKMLTIQQIHKLQPADSIYKRGDGRGLYLLIHPNGGKYWRYSYRFEGKCKTLALGVYPVVSPEVARAGRDEARRMLVAGIDPVEVKRQAAEIKKAQAKGLPTFRLSMTDGALNIQSKARKMLLTAEQTAAVRAFLIATPTL